MTFEEFKNEIDVYQAYWEWNPVSYLKRLGTIPPEYAKFFPDTCECGSDVIMKSSLTQSMCCNPQCFVKVGYKLAMFMNKAGVKGLGERTCSILYNAFVQKDSTLRKEGKEPIFKIGSCFEIFTVPYDEYPASVYGSIKAQEFYAAVQAMLKQSYTLPALVGMLALPSLGTRKSAQLLDGIDSFNELVETINNSGGLHNFCYNRGFKSPVVATELRASMNDIAAACYIFQRTIRSTGMIKIRVCMTGRIVWRGNSITKSKMIELLNSVSVDSEGVQLFEFENTAGCGTDPFVLYSYQSSDRKYTVGASRGIEHDEFGTHSVLMTVDDFFNVMEGAMQEWNKMTEEQKTSSSPISMIVNSLTQFQQKSLQKDTNQEENLTTLPDFLQQKIPTTPVKAF